MRHLPSTGIIFLVLCGLIASTATAQESRKDLAERFLRGVYACGPSEVEELASDDIVLSYPVFETIFGTPALRGREAVLAFAARFCERWEDREITIHAAVEEGDSVVLIWSFRARSTAPESSEPASTNEMQSWGGITFYGFDSAGRISAEIGEESNPGPQGRTSFFEAQN